MAGPQFDTSEVSHCRPQQRGTDIRARRETTVLEGNDDLYLDNTSTYASRLYRYLMNSASYTNTGSSFRLIHGSFAELDFILDIVDECRGHQNPGDPLNLAVSQGHESCVCLQVKAWERISAQQSKD